MTDEEFEKISNDFDKQSRYFHDDTCSAVFIDMHEFDGEIDFRGEDEYGNDFGVILNAGDAVYIFSTFLDMHPDIPEYFNHYLGKIGYELKKKEK